MPTTAPAPQPTRRQGKAVQRRTRMRGATGGPSTAAKPNTGFTAKARYRFDNALARGPIVVIAYLAALSGLVIVAAAAISIALPPHLRWQPGWRRVR